MNKVRSLRKIEALTDNDMRVFLSLVSNEDFVYSEEEVINDFNNDIEDVLEESFLMHSIAPRIRVVIDELREKLIQRILNEEHEELE